MSVRETADVVLAKASAAEEQPNEASERFVTVNVVHGDGAACAKHESGLPCRDEGHWGYSVQGEDYDAFTLTERLAAVAEDAMEPADGGARRFSAVTVSIRCDRGAPYGFVQSALGSCAATGIHRTELAAARPTED